MSFAKELDELLRTGRELPTLPDVVLELRTALDDDEMADSDIAAIIEKDPVITGRLLRLANSTHYRRGSEVTTVLGAIQRVGLREVRAICVVLAVVDAFSRVKGDLDLRHFWDHSAAVGRVAQLINTKLPRDEGVGADDVYVAGLLHDVGILLLDQFFQERFRMNLHARIASDWPLWKVEQERMGMDHAEVGSLLVKQWALPEAMSQCIAGHHQPERAPEEYQRSCRVILAAETLCTSLGADAGVEGPSQYDAFSVLQDLGMPDAEIDAFLTDIESVGISVRGAFAG
jgi:HD-like signal output (HDOD) protein